LREGCLVASGKAEASEEDLKAAHLTEAEARLELALALYAQERITQVGAARMAEISFMDFQRVRSERGIPIHYDREMLEEDLRHAASLRPR
jgi:predicted HTH domain antitoxin